MIGAWELDSINNVDLLALCDGLPDASVDCILADLPYGTTACSWDTVIPFAPMWERFRRVIKPRGAIVLTASQPFTSALVMSNVKMFKYSWVWDKALSGSFQNAKYQPLKITEDVLIFGSGSVNYYPSMVRGRLRFKSGHRGSQVSTGLKPNPAYLSDAYYPVNLVRFPNCGNKQENLHPTQKPVALFEYLIRTYTRDGELVFDPVCGSGTTALAARNAKRHWLCGDTDAHFCDVARDRLRLPFEARVVKAANDMSGLPLFEQVQP